MLNNIELRPKVLAQYCSTFISKSDIRPIFMKIKSLELLFNSLQSKANIERKRST